MRKWNLLIVLILTGCVFGQSTIRPPLTVSDSSTRAPLHVTARATAPSTPATGDLYLDTGANTSHGKVGWRRYTGAAWVDVGQGSDPNLTLWAAYEPNDKETRFQINITDPPYNAVGDGVTDNTAAFMRAYNAAIAAGGGTVLIPIGTFLADLVFDDDSTYALHGPIPGVAAVNIHGVSITGSRLQAYTAGGYAITITGKGSFAPFKIDNLTIDGNNKTCSGIYASTVSSLGGHIDHVNFWMCQYGIQNVGSIWYQVTFCNFERGEYGAKISPVPLMHGGCGFFQYCNFYLNSTVGFYVDGNVEQVGLRNSICESNAFNIVLENVGFANPFIIDDVYIEDGGRSEFEPITLDNGHTYASVNTTGIRLDGCDWVVFKNCNHGFTAPDVNNSNLTFERCWIVGSKGDPNVTGTSSRVKYTDCFYDSTYAGKYLYTMGGINLNRGDVIRAEIERPITTNIDWSKTNLFTDGALASMTTISDANSMSYSFVDSGNPMGGRYLSVRLKPGTAYDDGIRIFPSAVTVDKTKFHVTSFDARCDTNSVSLGFIDASYGIVNQAPKPDTNWHRYYCLKSPGTAGTVNIYANLRMYNYSATPERVHLANFQLVAFTTEEQAERYIEAGGYAGINSGLPSMLANTISLRGVTYTPPPADGNSGDVLYTNGASKWSWKAAGAGGGSGDVTGPATNHDNYIPQWNGADSKTLKDGLAIGTSAGTLAAGDHTHSGVYQPTDANLTGLAAVNWTTGQIVKSTGTGGFAAASSGTDYAPATSGSAILKGNGSGGFSSASAGTDYEAAHDWTSADLLIKTGSVPDANTAAVANGDTKHLATGDQIYDFVTGLGYLTGVTVDSPLSGSGTSGSHLSITAGGINATLLQSAAADISANDVAINLSNNHSGKSTSLTVNGSLNVTDTSYTGTLYNNAFRFSESSVAYFDAYKTGGGAGLKFRTSNASPLDVTALELTKEGNGIFAGTVQATGFTGNVSGTSTGFAAGSLDTIDLLKLTGTLPDANTASISNGDTKHLANNDQVYDFVTGLGYLTTVDISANTNFGTAMAAIDLLVASGDGVDANTASVANGDTKHLATGDQIYDFVTGLGYITNSGNTSGTAGGLTATALDSIDLLKMTGTLPDVNTAAITAGDTKHMATNAQIATYVTGLSKSYSLSIPVPADQFVNDPNWVVDLYTSAAITITEIRISHDAIPASDELNADLCYKDAMIGATGDSTLGAIDTTNGVYVGTGLSYAVPAGKHLFIKNNASPDAAAKTLSIKIIYHY